MSEVIDHVGIRVSDLAASRRMDEAALAELGFTVLGEGAFEGDAYVLFGRGTSDDFALHTVGTKPGRNRVTTGARRISRAGCVRCRALARSGRWQSRHGQRSAGGPPRVQRPLLRRVRARSGRQQRGSRVPRSCRGPVVVNCQRVRSFGLHERVRWLTRSTATPKRSFWVVGACALRGRGVVVSPPASWSRRSRGAQSRFRPVRSSTLTSTTRLLGTTPRQPNCGEPHTHARPDQASVTASFLNALAGRPTRKRWPRRSGPLRPALPAMRAWPDYRPFARASISRIDPTTDLEVVDLEGSAAPSR
jgi:hypothetical protein